MTLTEKFAADESRKQKAAAYDALVEQEKAQQAQDFSDYNAKIERELGKKEGLWEALLSLAGLNNKPTTTPKNIVPMDINSTSDVNSSVEPGLSDRIMQGDIIPSPSADTPTPTFKRRH